MDGKPILINRFIYTLDVLETNYSDSGVRLVALNSTKLLGIG